jgi:EAL domain-containing protein (putative c-di-GMP-specific phosphodiesterase class I)
LLRWNHPSRGYIPPAVFVRVAEEAGLMDQLGAFVLRRALADATQWPGLYVAVNLSPVQVRDRRFVALVAEVLAETQTDPARVVLEITEGVLIDDPLTAKSRLEDLRRLGVQLALDDFGSGYSSLAYLQQLPFDKLKIDRGFVAALDQSANTGVIIQAIVTLGRALGMSVLIEGVETEEQRVLLRLAGCNEMQGFLFAKPQPAQEINRLLADAGALPSLIAKAG